MEKDDSRSHQPAILSRRRFLANTTKVTVGSSLLVAAASENSALAQSVPTTGVVNVRDYGAKGDGSTDDTNAIQNAINTIGNAGGGTVLVPDANYLCHGALSLTNGVTLSGGRQGPFIPTSLTNQPTLSVTDTNTAFLTLSGNSSVQNLAFYYPNQVSPGSSTPIPYPPTVLAAQSGTGGVTIRGCTAINAYRFIDIETARTGVTDCFVGCYFMGITVDHVTDYAFIGRVAFMPLYDAFAGVSYPSPMDTWVLNNGYSISIYRADAIRISDIGSFSKYAHFLITDSPDTTLNPRNGYGTLENIDLDTCQYGIVCQSTDNVGGGFKITNLDIGSAYLPKSAILMQSGGTSAPTLTVSSGSVRGTWAIGSPWQVQAGNLYVSNIRGYESFVTSTNSNGTPLANDATRVVTSVTLDAGQWLVWGSVAFLQTGATVKLTRCGISTSVAMPGAFSGQVTYVPNVKGNQIWPTGTAYLTFSAQTTVYLLANAHFSGGRCVAGGVLNAKRLDV